VLTGAAIAVIGTIAGVLSQLENIHGSWCKYFGIFCTFEISSAPITVSAGGTNDGNSDVCKSKAIPLCVSPTTSWRKLDTNSRRFIATSVEGNYDDGDPKKAVPSMAGWYPDLDNTTPQKICVIVFARTGACETRFSVTGKLTATEHISWW
jgi:hypothetical protein